MEILEKINFILNIVTISSLTQNILYGLIFSTYLYLASTVFYKKYYKQKKLFISLSPLADQTECVYTYMASERFQKSSQPTDTPIKPSKTNQ